MNYGPRSDITTSSKPWWRQTLRRKALATALAVISFIRMNFFIFVNLSTITMMYSKPFDFGNGPIKSTEISYQGREARDIGLRKP